MTSCMKFEFCVVYGSGSIKPLDDHKTRHDDLGKLR